MSVKSIKELYENRDSEIESNGSNKSNKKANKKQASVLPPISVSNRKQKEASADSGKSSHTSSRRGSVIEVRDNTDENPYIDLVIYGKSISTQSVSSDKSTPSRNSSKISEQKSPLNIEKSDASYNQKSSPDERHVRRTKRTNSLPGIINKYPLEASPTQPVLKYVQNSKKSSKRRSTEKETRSVECVFKENLSLDLSRMSDFADSEDEALGQDVNFKQKVSKNPNLSRRRRSIEKDKILSTRSGTSKNTSGASSRIITRRSSLQSFSPRGLSFTTTYDGCTTHSKTPSPYFWNNQNTSSSNEPNSKVAYSPVSPDYTSEPSTCETSPCKLSPNDSVVPDRLLYVPINSNQATISPTSQIPCLSSSSSCYTSWMEKSVESEFTQHNGQDTNGTHNGTPIKERGEWDSFWKNYKSVGAFPKQFYDNCPTPFYQENQTYVNNCNEAISTDCNGERIDEESVNNSADEVKCIYLSKCEVQEIIKCAHRLAEILTLALEKSEREVRNVESRGVQVNIGNEFKRSQSETKINNDKKQVCKFSLEPKKSLPLVLELNEVSFKNDSVERKEYGSVDRSLHRDVENMFLLEDPKDVHL